MKDTIRRAINSKAIFIVLVMFICLKSCELKSYHKYEGKITGFEEVNAKYFTYRGGRYGSDYGKMTIPLFEYYKGKDTIESSDGNIVFLSNFTVGEKIEILENKDFKNKVMIFSFFYFWLKFPELIILILFYVIVYGFFKLYGSKKNTE